MLKHFFKNIFLACTLHLESVKKCQIYIKIYLMHFMYDVPAVEKSETTLKIWIYIYGRHRYKERLSLITFLIQLRS